MKSNDLIKIRSDIRVKMQKAFRENDETALSEALDSLMECAADGVRQEYEARMEGLQQQMDSAALTARGARQLTKQEREYYQKLAGAMRSASPKQALENLDVVMPETVINSVFEDIKQNHPLLSKINFIHTGADVKLYVNTAGVLEAAWGELTEEIVKELTGGFKEIECGLLKLSAFLPVSKAMLDLGPEWLDRYIREMLYEAAANGLESAYVSGNGNKKPIGMNRQVGDDVVITAGAYPEKEKIKVTDFSAKTVGGLLAQVAKDENGKDRVVRDVILVVNPGDYLKKVMPVTTIMAPDGTYRRDVMPFPMDIIQSPSVAEGEARFGLAYRYFGAAGTNKSGNIDYSDHQKFLEDKRVYLIKAYANGMPMDNNAFLNLDISELEPQVLKVHIDNEALDVNMTAVVDE